jgi:hypothetical protein
MGSVRPALSIVLLVAGVIFVFAGLNAAVGFSAVGIVSSIGAIAALLYSGAVWFGGRGPDPPGPEKVFVYDQSLKLASGSRRGQAVSSCFPASVRAELESRCLDALAGHGARFSCASGSDHLAFDAVPVRSADGRIVYGLLITAAENAAPALN